MTFETFSLLAQDGLAAGAIHVLLPVPPGTGSRRSVVHARSSSWHIVANSNSEAMSRRRHRH
ncbi:MAG TPA: hypothetical protein VGJ35_09185 [Burkholderiaceae bacterium]